MDAQKHVGKGAILLGLFCLMLSAVQVDARKHRDEHSSELRHVIDPLYNFTEKLYLTLNDGKGESKNIIVSPISMHKALNLVLLGTKPKTESERQLHHTLGYSNMSDDDVLKCHEDYALLLDKFKRLKEKAAAKIEQEKKAPSDEWGEKQKSYPTVLDLFNMVIVKNHAKILPEYKEKIGEHYNSSVERVSDSEPKSKARVMKHLNDWAKEAGFDSPIMKQREIDDKFEAMLLSAIRVQTSWRGDFGESESKTVFYNQGMKDKPVKGKKLRKFGLNVAWLELPKSATALRGANSLPKILRDIHAQIVSVPLEGGLTITIFQPAEYSTGPDDNKLQELIELLFSQRRLPAALELIDEWRPSEITLTLPKFKFEKELEMKEYLESMGLKQVFELGSEITKITTEQLAISSVKHQAVIEVNRFGIKAAGVTKIKTLPMAPYPGPGALPKPREVIIDKPFLFLIRYGKLPLFVGQLSNL